MVTLRSIPLIDIVELRPSALQDLAHAATKQGFFYLELNDTSGSNPIWATVAECRAMATELYALPVEERLAYDIDEIGNYKLNGYKPIGRNNGTHEGKKDGFEVYLLPRDGIANNQPGEATWLRPPVLKRDDPMLKRMMDQLHAAGLAIMKALAVVLELPDPLRFARQHHPDARSTTALAMLRYPTQPSGSNLAGHNAHTDVGSLTFLFPTGTGLQLLDPATREWSDVQVQPGKAIVNIGDSIRFMSGGRFLSCLHRVVTNLGPNARERQSLVYFMRPSLDATFQDDNGKEWTSEGWHALKYKATRATAEEQASKENSQVITGKPGYLGFEPNSLA